VDRLELESDSVVAISAGKCTAPNKSRLWSNYNDIAEAKCLIPACYMSFTRRKLNVLAHNLAQYANRSGVCNRWLDPVPIFIAELAKQDLVNYAVD
jgi:hypothetical protein